MNKIIAHKITSEIWRSSDIKFDETVFEDFNLNPQLLKGLKKSGFQRPSEIQLKSIPYGRLGLDLFVQSKSGTGKTCVFAVIVLDSIELSNCCQCLILVPTREIAGQTFEVFSSFGKFMKGLKIKKYIGGCELKKDIETAKYCHIAIGTPGRIKCLIDMGYLKTNSIRTLVLDEADKLFDENFTEQINDITVQLPSSKQTILVTATSTTSVFNYIQKNMKDAKHIQLEYDRICLTGVDQYYWNVGHLPIEHFKDNLTEKVLFILKNVSFSQCMIFSNSETKTDLIRPRIQDAGWSTEKISGRFHQKMRDKVIKSMKNLDFKILFCTDLIARGIDCENVNLVINLDIPNDLETYLHRCGRCGRFGQHGLAITLCTCLSDFQSINSIKEQLGENLVELPDVSECDLWKFRNKFNSNVSFSFDDLKDEPTYNLMKVKGKYQTFNDLAAEYELFETSTCINSEIK